MHDDPGDYSLRSPYFVPYDQVKKGPPVVPGNFLQEIQEIRSLPETKPARKTLHWYQWFVYTIVLITCIAVLYGLWETYAFIDRLRDAMHLYETFIG